MIICRIMYLVHCICVEFKKNTYLYFFQLTYAFLTSERNKIVGFKKDSYSLECNIWTCLINTHKLPTFINK